MIKDFDTETYFQKLLDQTVLNAYTKPSYQVLWANIDAPEGAPPRFDQLPLITRPQFIEANRGIPHTDDVAVVHHSTGTTGAAFFRHRTATEIRYLTEFYSKLIEHDHPGWNTAERPMVLSETDGYHGTPIPVPSNALVVHAQASDGAMLDQTIDTLTREYDIARTTPHPVAITGTEEFILLITLELRRRGIDPASLGVKFLMTRGHYLSEERRKVFARHWGIQVSDYFSLSEILGSAERSPITRRYKFSPTVFVEFISLHDESAVTSGLAELVLTELTPFVSYEPLIRYRTGDLVEVLGDDTFASLSEFTPRGRIKRSLFAQDGTLLIAQYDLISILDAFPDIAREAPEAWVAKRFGPVPLGLPLADISLMDRQLRVTVQLIYAASIFPDAAKTFCTGLHKRLYDCVAETAGETAAKALTITVTATDAQIAPAAICGR